MEYGIQLYSIRDDMQRDMRGSLQKIAALGYKMVEFAGFFDHSAEDVAAMLKENGLTVSGTHTGLAAITQDFDGAVAYHKAIGNRNIIIPGHDLSTQEKIDEFIALVNEYQPKLEAHGITLGFHNHSGEFLPNADGSVSYNDITARTKLRLEIDTFWAYAAGKDPIALMETFKSRLHFIHIKDGLQNGEGFPLGKGTAPVKAVYEKAAALHIPMVVESETQNPDGFTEAKICIDYLRALENQLNAK